MGGCRMCRNPTTGERVRGAAVDAIGEKDSGWVRGSETHAWRASQTNSYFGRAEDAAELGAFSKLAPKFVRLDRHLGAVVVEVEQAGARAGSADVAREPGHDD